MPGSIRELIPEKYRSRYLRWKREYLATQAGLSQWTRYSEDPAFTLTITVSRELGSGAQVSAYRWDEAGNLAAATITLGSSLDKGYPAPFHYPVTSALALRETSSGERVEGEVLAATKLAHEFGHVNHTAQSEMHDFLLQQELAPLYNRIFYANGLRTEDGRLRELARRMGGTPVEISREREHWAEAEALRYLRERLRGGRISRAVFGQIRQSVELYAREHAARFR